MAAIGSRANSPPQVPFGWDPLKLGQGKKSEAQRAASLMSELKNGRLAMVGIASLYVATVVPNSVPFLGDAFDWAAAPAAADLAADLAAPVVSIASSAASAGEALVAAASSSVEAVATPATGEYAAAEAAVASGL